MQLRYAPADIEKFGGPSPDVLRDWRRRALLRNIGAVALPDGNWTGDLDDPRLPAGGRLTWGYLKGEMLRLVLARELTKLGLDLDRAMLVSDLAAQHVVDWIVPAVTAKNMVRRSHRFIAAWPGEDSNDPNERFRRLVMVRLDDLNRLPLHAGPKSIILDLEKLAAALPEKLRALWSA